MSKITYNEKSNDAELGTVDRSWTAANANEVKVSVNQLYDLVNQLGEDLGNIKSSDLQFLPFQLNQGSFVEFPALVGKAKSRLMVIFESFVISDTEEWQNGEGVFDPESGRIIRAMELTGIGQIIIKPEV